MTPYLFVTFEFCTVCGYITVFYCLFEELKKILSFHRYQEIKYRTATYLALISILQAARFFYYGVIWLTYALMDGEKHVLKCEDLLPSYLTEIFFCLFVIYHIVVEGKTKISDERDASVVRSRQSSSNNFLLSDSHS